MKKIMIVLLALVMVMSFVACGSPAPVAEQAAPAKEEAAPAKEEASPADDTKTVAYTTMGFDSPYWVEVANGVEDAAKDLGWEAIIHDAKGDVASQIAAMENFIIQDVDFIIVSALDAAALDPLIKKAMDAGIGVIGQSTVNESQILREGPDQADLGNAVGNGAGAWAKANLDGEMIKGVTYFVQCDPQTVIREQAIRDTFESYYPNITWVNEVGTIDSLTLEDGMNNMEGLIQSDPDIQVVLSCCDDGLVGSYEVAKSNNMDLSKMIFGGINALPQVLDMMKEEGTDGAYRVTVDSDAYMCGRQCVEEIAVKWLDGEELEDAYGAPAKAVTLENLDGYFDADGNLISGSQAYRSEHY